MHFGIRFGVSLSSHWKQFVTSTRDAFARHVLLLLLLPNLASVLLYICFVSTLFHLSFLVLLSYLLFLFSPIFAFSLSLSISLPSLWLCPCMSLLISIPSFQIQFKALMIVSSISFSVPDLRVSLSLSFSISVSYFCFSLSSVYFIHVSVSVYVPFVFLDLRLIRLFITLVFPLISLLSQLVHLSFDVHCFYVTSLPFFGRDYLLNTTFLFSSHVVFLLSFQRGSVLLSS